MDTLEGTVAEVLREVTYPAEKWQITTCADLHGTDIRTRRALYSLPVQRYESATEVAAALKDV
jgi:hypothetical protein